MEQQQPQDLKTAIDGLLWLSVESVGQPFFIDISVWSSREIVQVEIVEIAKSAEAIYLDNSAGKPFTPETIQAMEDRLIEALSNLQTPIEQPEEVCA